MRPLEMALLFANIPMLGMCMATKRSPIWGRAAATLVVALAAIEVLVDGQRWQMYPAYLAVAWVVLTFALTSLPIRRFWTGLTTIGCLMTSAALCFALPVFELPTPTGPFPIGSVKRHLVDSRRQELQNARPGALRELMIQIWYPAKAHSGRGQPYCSSAEMPLKKKQFSLVRTHAATGVPFARTPGKCPVLIFTPSWTGGRVQNTFQAEELASHGFVVVGIDHPYGTHRTLFPDGRVIKSTLGDWLDFTSESNFQATLRSANEQMRVRTADARFALDTLERWDLCDPSGLFTGRLDTARVGIWGHSFGGAVAAEVCRLDRRFQAGVDMDGCLFGYSALDGVEQPLLVMSSDMSPPTPYELASSTGSRHRYLAFLDQDERNIRRSLNKYGGYFLSIQGTNHLNYCDSPLYSPFKGLIGAGSIDVGRSMRIINDYTLAFFRQYLNGRPALLFRSSAPQYPEVRLEMWQTPRRKATQHSRGSKAETTDLPMTTYLSL
jgi:dienelactone hydrolase